MDEWISVNDERKPRLMTGEESISVQVLLYVPRFVGSHGNADDNGIRMGHYFHMSKQFRPESSMGFEKDVTHWRPVPEPPTT